MDVCINSLVPNNKKILIINNGAYSKRAVEIANAYSLDVINLETEIDKPFMPQMLDAVLKENKDVAVVYITHNETGTGLLNPIREIGEIAHSYGCIFVVDTTSTYALLPIDIEKDNIDFIADPGFCGMLCPESDHHHFIHSGPGSLCAWRQALHVHRT